MTDWVERKRTEMYKACIFDLDGTLADTVESIANVANQILERFGAPAQPVEDYKYHAGDGGNVLMERCMKAAGADMSRLEEGQRLSAYRNHKRLSCRLPVYARSVFPFHHNQISQFFLPDLSRAFTLQKNPQIFQLLLAV